MTVLLVEDNKTLCKSIEHFLIKSGIRCDVASDGESGQFLAENGYYDVLILDIGLPQKSGIEILSSLRKKGIQSPVLMLTASDGIDFKEISFELGADDYLVKPFVDKELLLRVKALARRPREALDDFFITVGKTRLSVLNERVEIDGKPVSVSAKEFRLLEFLFKRKGSYVSKGLILDAVWGFDKSIQSNNVEVYVRTLRKRFPSEQSGFVIETKYGVGYRLTEVSGDV